MITLIQIGFYLFCQLSTISSTTQTYELIIERKLVSPDGYSVPALTVNGQFPGPTIRGMVGDTMSVRIINMAAMTDALSIHWHGIKQRGTPWSDGASYVTNCPILHGSNYTYTFMLDVPGTYFYHAHTGGAASEGAYGMLIVDDTSPPFKFDAELEIILSDWYHASTGLIIAGLEHNPFIWPGVGNSLLINGRGICKECDVSGSPGKVSTTYPDGSQSSVSFSCTGSRAVFEIDHGKTYLLRIVNAASLAFFNFAISQHILRVIGVGSCLIEPFSTSSVDLSPGQRLEVLLTSDQPESTYAIQVQTEWRGTDVSPAGVATGLLQYHGASLSDVAHIHNESLNDNRDWFEWNKLLKAQSFNPLRCPTNVIPDQELVLSIQQQYVDTNTGQGFSPPSKTPGTSRSKMGWTMFNNSVLKLPKTPYMIQKFVSPNSSGSSYTSGSAPIRVEFGAVVDIVIQNSVSTSGICEQHPWHLHGFQFWLLGQGSGEYDPAVHRHAFNFDNPLRLDTVTGYPSNYSNRRGHKTERGMWMQPCGWIAIRFVADNPGMWLFHCHINWHMEMGMGIVFDVASELVSTPPPDDYRSCGEISHLYTHKTPESSVSYNQTTAACRGRTSSEWSVGQSSIIIFLMSILIMLIITTRLLCLTERNSLVKRDISILSSYISNFSLFPNSKLNKYVDRMGNKHESLPDTDVIDIVHSPIQVKL